MNKERIDKLMPILLSISSLLIIAGAFLKIYHNQNGYTILISGFLLNLILSNFEIRRLKKTINELEDKSAPTDDAA